MLKRPMIAMIRFYRRAISPLTPPSCRFVPTCSAYALEAVERYGAAHGGWLALRRLLRCHPFNKGGYDPVPGITRHEPLDDTPHEDGGAGTG